MHVKKCGPELQILFAQVSAVLKGLTASDPMHHGKRTGTNVDWYVAGDKTRVAGDKTRFVWFRLIERGGTKNPPKSILFAVQRNENYAAFGAVDGNDWYGPSSNLVVKAGSQEDFANLLGYLREWYLQFNP